MTPAPTKLKGFTPVIDVVVKEVGLTQAAVFGAVWRYCQMKDRTCTASLERIAERVNLSSRTVLRHVKELCKAGYLIDLTPGLRNEPHTYADTRKASLQVVLEAGLSSDLGTTESHSRYDRESHLGMTESQLKKHLKKQREKKDCPADAGGEQQSADVQSVVKESKGSKNSTPRAVKVFREMAHRYPAKAWYRTVETTVGDESDDLDFWAQVVRAYVGLGWNPTNVKNMLAYYEKREIPSIRRGQGILPRGRPTLDDKMAMIQEWGQSEG